ncbi:unnamed protein product [Leptosia nina]|uniref:Uncharacterized protein n=1 Tax=Leptosia nina TaxID=320188 RepID=A0AAV1K2N5_9NEOP
MDLIKYLSVLVIFFVDSDAGGHGGKHHVNLKIHLPEFIHHDHHKKVITIHHHHHKPKKEHHHHHHHHKPHTPHGHHYHHHHKKTSTHAVSKGHSNHHGHGHGHHGLGHHGHGHHGHGHHGHKAHDTPIVYDPPTVNFEPPTYNYQPPAINYEPPSYDYSPNTFTHDFGYTPAAPSAPEAPRVHGVVHTVKQVKVFDSLPNSLHGIAKPGNTYEVTEEGNDDDDVFTAVNSGSQAFPGTFGFVKSAVADNEPFNAIPQDNSYVSKNPFANAIQQPYANLETFTSEQNNDNPIKVEATQFVNHEGTGFDDANVIGDIGSRALLAASAGFSDNTPVTFSRQAGVQETINSEGVQTTEY